MQVKPARLLATKLAAAIAACVILVPASSALAGAAGQDPANCAQGQTWRYKDFNVNGTILRQELRHSWYCGVVGWGRLTRIGGTSQNLAVIQSAWNPGGASQYGVPGTNWTYTVDARAGREVCAGFHAYWIDGRGRRHYIGWFFAGCYWG